MKNLVSVVVPSCNSVAFIDATIESILNQTFTDFELLISDHGSTDGTWEALQKYTADPRVQLSQLPSGGGGVANWKAVTDAASGEFIKLVCGDDLLYPNCLERQVQALIDHPAAVLAASSKDVIDATGAMLIRNRGLAGLHGEVDGADAIRKSLRAGTNILGEPASVLFRRQALVAAGGWDGRLPYLLDQATYSAVLLRGNLVAVPGPLAAFRVSNSQWSVRLVREQADQFIGFHRSFSAQHPGLLSSSDLAIGGLRARFNAVARRAVYLWLDRRMAESRKTHS